MKLIELRVLDGNDDERTSFLNPEAVTSITGIGPFTWIDCGHTTFKIRGSVQDAIDALGSEPCRC